MINNNNRKPDCLCEERKCIICGGTFWVGLPNSKGRKLLHNLRGRNCITCSPSCSRKNYDNKNKKNNNRAKKEVKK